MRSQPAPTTSSAGNRQARRKARKLAERQRRRSGATRQAATPAGADEIAAAVEHVRAHRLDEAERLLRKVVEATPDAALAWNVLGQLLEQRGCRKEACHHHKQAVTAEPENSNYWRDLGVCLRRLGEYRAAVITLEKAVALCPNEASHYRELAWAHSSANDVVAAITALDEAIRLRPDFVMLHFDKGCQLQYRGEFDAARACFEEALHLDPDLLEVHYQMIQMGMTATDEETVAVQLEAALAEPNMTPRRRSISLFTLAKLRERRRDYDAAFHLYAAANDAIKAFGEFDRAQCQSFFDASIAGFTSETFERLKNAGSSSNLPVFIVGMPRSGTTLVEQIISSHPQAFAGGELNKFGQIADALTEQRSATHRYPRDAAMLEPARLSEMGRHYLAHLQELAPPDAVRFTDKRPFNFYHVGLIAALFPNARIINCRRDPMDTCLSCYFQNFTGPGARFSNDLGDLGFLYRQYQRVMDHWRTVLPTPIFDVDYDDLIQNQEAVSRHLVDFVGLDWDDRCLKFHENGRSVMTASQAQVRQPMYTSSLGKWHHYERHLGPLKEALACEA